MDRARGGGRRVEMACDRGRCLETVYELSGAGSETEVSGVGEMLVEEGC